MANVVILGAGVAGHTAAAFLKKWLGRKHQVIVVSPKPDYNWLPSNIWVGLGRIPPRSVVIPLKPVYDKAGIIFKQARAVTLFPEGSAAMNGPHVEIEYTDAARNGQHELVAYDFLINATGPKLKFEATEGLGPDHFTLSVCTADHADHAAHTFLENVEAMKRGESRRFVIGTGHGTCTCQGAAMEYVVNLESELRRHGVRDKAEVLYLSNEYELGDFGMGGAHIRKGGYITPTSIFTASLFAERGIDWVLQAHVEKIEQNQIFYTNLEGEKHTLNYDFAMLLPPFSGVGIKAINANGEDISAKLFAPNGFMRVDADYSAKTYEEWRADDWPKTYQSPVYPNIFAAGIAFAPPHAISQPHFTKDGLPIFATAPRTGMPSATIGKIVAESVRDKVHGANHALRTASMAKMGAACVASTGTGLTKGSAAAMTVFPIVPDFQTYPEYGRDLRFTMGEIGLAGHWTKVVLHYLFLYKAKLLPGWTFIPE
jgi:sulfide:quinone oxidoreductase